VKTIIAGKIRLERTELLKNKIRLKLAGEILRNEIDLFIPNVILCENIFAGHVAIDTVGDSVPVITDVHSIVSAEYEGDTFRKIIKEQADYLKQVEDLVFRCSSKVIAVSHLMKTYIAEKHGVNNARLYVIPNGSDIREQTAQYRDPLRVIYGGAFAYYENIDSYLDLAKRNERYAFYLAGDGPLRKHVFRRIRDERINLHYLGYLKYSDSIAEFANMNVGVMPAVETLNIRMTYPVKVFDYLSCGLPVITPDFGEWSKVVAKTRCGLVTRTSNAEEFYECLRSLDRCTWQEMSSNGLRLIREEFNWNSLLRKLDEIVDPFR
jgi:hypothetical protein